MASDTDSVKFEANVQLFYNVIVTEICVLFKLKVTNMLSNASKFSCNGQLFYNKISAIMIELCVPF